MTISCDRVRDLAPGFVLGALDPYDMAAVRSHMAACRREHPELSELGGVVSYIGESIEPVEPPRHLRSAVLAAVQADMDARRVAAKPAGLAAKAPAKAAPTELAPVVSLTAVRAVRSHRAMSWAARAAAIVAIVALGGYAVAIQGDLGKAHDQQTHNQDVYNAFGVPGSRSAVLMPEKGQKGGGVAVMLPSGHVALEFHGLSATAGDQVYGVWFSADGGPLTKAATFTVDTQGNAWPSLDSVPPNSSLWVMVCREANKDVFKPGTTVLTGTIWVFETPAPTPTD
jgi:hypothetical protein